MPANVENGCYAMAFRQRPETNYERAAQNSARQAGKTHLIANEERTVAGS
jgi:hypothetical protein